jgi:plasmid stability protein
MPSLQIRDCPEPLHQLLQLRARRHHRSLSQQALVDLQQVCGGDPRERRQQALNALQAMARQLPPRRFDPSPEELIRQDRDR